ncbi:MAG: LarC family nickel insertion protein [Kiritimatiellae bacterium]|nr:LarC family nickel insertion protein [Kiritimatiellia bacterium]
MRRILFLDGTNGMSGDMLAASLLDLGASEKKLRDALAPLAAEGLSFSVSRGNSHGIAGTVFSVSLPDGEAPLPYPETETPGHPRHRHPADVRAVLSRLPMAEGARRLAEGMFDILAEAEARVHGVAKEEVHFHEVGALDSIADIAGIAVLADDLACDACAVGDLVAGYGSIRAAHGVLPVPVPAVAEIARASGLVLQRGPAEGERLTPTGIAAAAVLKTLDAPPERYRVLARGTGIGKRDFGMPNALTALLLEEAAEEAPDACGEKELVFEVDDATGEALAEAAGKLYAAGAKEVHFLPVFMKKGRPGWQVQAIAGAREMRAVAEAAFRHTTTIGLRVRSIERIKMARAAGEVAVCGHRIAVKKASLWGIERTWPEAESVRAAAAALGRSFCEIHALAVAEAARGGPAGLTPPPDGCAGR